MCVVQLSNEDVGKRREWIVIPRMILAAMQLDDE